MVRFFQSTYPTGVPRIYTIIETLFYMWIHHSQPVGIPTDSPITIDFDNTTQLSVCCCMKVMFCSTDRNICPEHLVAFLILAYEKFTFTQCPFHCREKMRNGLCIVPYMCTRTMAGAPGISTSFIIP